MAHNKGRALLGYYDEPVNEKHKNCINFTTNKIGGCPDTPNNLRLDVPPCPLCRLQRPLVVQVYAPLEGSIYHRTLYLFACINPNCWNDSESWICVRAQYEDKKTETVRNIAASKATDWCNDAENWDDDNANEGVLDNVEKISDEESISLEDSFSSALCLTVDDENANIGAQGGPIKQKRSPDASAELEGNEGEIISIDTPFFPQHNVRDLLNDTTPLPFDICQSNKKDSFFFVPYFMSVWEESNCSSPNDKHVKDLMREYKDIVGLEQKEVSSGLSDERYEKSNPIHGDKRFHQFILKIQDNPGQILRYIRDIEPPLVLYPLKDISGTCKYCGSAMTYEFQLLPTIIPKLMLNCDTTYYPRLEFGNIIVSTCEKSCSSSEFEFRYEVVILQKEVY